MIEDMNVVESNLEQSETVLKDRDQIVSATHSCKTENARRLCILDLAKKLKTNNEYDIGGVFSAKIVESDDAATDSVSIDGDKPNLWFFYKTSNLLGNNYLLNLFVCSREPGTFSIGIRSPMEQVDESNLPDSEPEYTWKSFQCLRNDDIFYVTTFHFYEIDLKLMENKKFYIPIKIEYMSYISKSDIVKQIKINHSNGKSLSKLGNCDFAFELSTGKVSKVNKIILAAHSSVLRELIVKNNITSLKLDDIADCDFDLLIEFLYSGTIENITKLNFNSINLINIAKQFNIKNLLLLLQNSIIANINTRNALEIACLSEDHNLLILQKKVFHFIQYNPSVLQSEAWENLNHISLAKKLIKFLYFNKNKK